MELAVSMMTVSKEVSDVDVSMKQLMVEIQYSRKWTQFVLVYQFISFTVIILINLLFFLNPQGCDVYLD
tara:strand:- start:3866 stop:4072 length:207 start_codon:yes stop_codon:yes gene_type:complete